MQRQSDRLPGARGRAARCLLLLWIILLIGGSREEKSWAQAGNREEVALYTFAVRAYQDGLYDLAKQQFQQYLTRFPQGARRGEVQFYLGELAFQAKQYEQAVQYYRQALPTLPDPVRTPARFKLGKLLYQLQRYPEVIEVLAPLRDQPGRWQEEALYWSGEAALKGGKLSEALPFWEQLLQAFPQGNYAAYAYYARGWIRQQQGKYALALQDFQKIEVLFPQSPLLLPAQLAMAHLLLTLERYGEAEEKFRWILEQDREERYQEEALFGWAESLLHARRYAEAVTAYERYRSTFPQGRWSETVLYNLGRAYYVQKEFAKAVELFREVRERFPQSSYLSSLLLMQARSYRALQQPQKAVQAYTEFLATAPQGQMRFLALSERGMLFYRLHRLDQARADFSQLRTPKAPAELQTLAEYMLGEIAFQGKEYEAALSHYLAVSQYPDTPAEVWYKLGYAYAVRKQYPPAVKALEKYLTFPLEQVDRKRGLALLIRVLLRQGDYEKAIARY
ncbi:MAG: tetratricopeptide repeat protein, partial [Nitrospinota bacterium]